MTADIKKYSKNKKFNIVCMILYFQLNNWFERMILLKGKKDKNEITIRSSAAEYLTYVAAIGDDKNSVEVRYEDENIWLTQKMLATVYGVNVATINEHIKNIYKDNELDEDWTIRKFLIVQKEGNRDVSRNVAHYNLQMIIAIGFKVDNERAVQFRKWANQIVKDYTIKGWLMDDERLKNGGSILTEKYRIIQDRIYISDFDELILNAKKIEESNNNWKNTIYIKIRLEEYLIIPTKNIEQILFNVFFV